jgi:antitoxin PrlF
LAKISSMLCKGLTKTYTIQGKSKIMSKVTDKYQITLPKGVRRELGIVPGTDVDIVKEGKRFLLVVNPADGIKKKWRGRFKDGSTTADYLDQVRGPIH